MRCCFSPSYRNIPLQIVNAENSCAKPSEPNRMPPRPTPEVKHGGAGMNQAVFSKKLDLLIRILCPRLLFGHSGVRLLGNGVRGKKHLLDFLPTQFNLLLLTKCERKPLPSFLEGT